MAEKRMFSKTIIDSDNFMDMPATARLLYYDLAMRADDDGFVNSPKKIIRMTGASPDDINILIHRQFIIPFDNGVVVIKHWRIHNYIRKDTYTPTLHTEEKALIECDENKAYTLRPRLVDGSSTVRPRLVDGSLTQIRIDKNRLDKINNISSDNNKKSDNKQQKKIKMTVIENDFNTIWALYPRKQGKQNAFKAYEKAILSGIHKQTIIDGINAYVKYLKANNVEARYIKQGSAWFNQQCWNDDYNIKGFDKNKKAYTQNDKHYADEDLFS